jgi:plastocyanin
MRKTIPIVVMCAALIASLGWLATTRAHLIARSSKSGPVEVKIDNYSFAPETITVAPGTTVTWVNHDDVPHTVKSDDGTFKSKALDTDDKFTMTFDKPGVYEYFCSIHPRMTAKIVVN